MAPKLSTALSLTALLLAQVNATSQEDMAGIPVHEQEGFNKEELVHSDEYGPWVHEPEMQRMIRGRRDLQTLFSTTQSLRCINCIQTQNFFCLNSSGSKGTCCKSQETCDEVDVCSYMVPQDSDGLKYWSCPHNLDVCGMQSFFVASKEVIKQEIKPTGPVGTWFTDGAMCHYRIVFPQGAGEFDQILINLEEGSRVSVLLTETETFRALDFKESEVRKQFQYAVTWPNEAFLVVSASEGNLLSYYNISYKYNDRDPDTVIANMTTEERDAYLNQNTISEEESVDDTYTFWFFVGGGILGGIIIIALIYCMVVVKRRNDVMVAKVEKMSTEQLNEKDYIPAEEQNDDFYASQRKAAQAKSKVVSKHIEVAVPRNAPFAPLSINNPDQTGQNTGAILTMKVADRGKTIVAPTKVDIKSDNASQDHGSARDEKVIAAAALNNDNRFNVTRDTGATQTQAEKEAEKFRKMKELLKQGDAAVPKRTVQGMINPTVTGASPERRNTIGRAQGAAGFVNIDAPEPAVARRMTMVSSTSQVVDYGDSSRQTNNNPSASIPAPVQSRVVFSGAGMGLGGGLGMESSNANSIELPQIGRRQGF